jgi:phosphoenolpyruvate carboxykinase (GTP)
VTVSAGDRVQQSLAVHLDSYHYQLLQHIPYREVQEFIAWCIGHCMPQSVYVSDGSAEALEYIRQRALANGEEMALAIPGHTAHFDHYKDQARDSDHTRILLSPGEVTDEHIVTLNREEGLEEIHHILRGIMRGHEMFVCFYTLGPAGSPFTIPCLQVTDSAYIAHCENILYRQGYEAFQSLTPEQIWFRFVHSQGTLTDRKTPANLDQRRVYIDLQEDIVYSANTQYGGNTIGLKKLAMRLAIHHAVNEGWLTEHMLVMGVEGPGDRITYFTGAFPSMCGKTSTAMLPGEHIIGDDIAHLRIIDGEARAVNAENGVFGILKNIKEEENPVQWQVLHQPGDIIFSNVLVTPQGQVHWLGKGTEDPPQGTNHSRVWWQGKTDDAGELIPVAHPNARFTAPLSMFPHLDKHLQDPGGVPIGAMVYGGRDAHTWVPVQEAFDWAHGIICKAASLESAKTAAVLTGINCREFNPMSNLDFLSVPIHKYIHANLDFGRRLTYQPIIFAVNYFLKDSAGEYLNAKIDKKVWYKWMELRVHREVYAIDTPTGRIPHYYDLKLLFRKVLGKRYSLHDYRQQFTIRVPENLAKVQRILHLYENMEGIPSTVFDQLNMERRRLEKVQRRYGDYIPPEKFITSNRID